MKTTVLWEFTLSEVPSEIQEFEDKARIIGGSLPEADRKRLYEMIYDAAYGLGDFYLLVLLNDFSVEDIPLGTPIILTVEMAEDWDQPKGTPDKAINVGQGDKIIWPVPEGETK